MSYRLAPRGVIEIATGALILPHMQRWRDYEEWLRAGGVVAPIEVVPVPPTQAELDAAAEQAARKAMRAALRADATIRFLRTHTPAECATWVSSNVTDLASAKNVLAKMAMVVAYLARERLAADEQDPPPDPTMG